MGLGLLAVGEQRWVLVPRKDPPRRALRPDGRELPLDGASVDSGRQF